MKVLFVCTGNTCRSPMAEGLLKHIVSEIQDDIVVLSAGLFAQEGQPVSPEAVAAIASKISIKDHKARLVTKEFVEVVDYIITMTKGHKDMMLNVYPDAQDRIMTLTEWAGHDDGSDISDPFGQSQEVYNHCAQEIEQYIKEGLKKRKK